MKSVGSFCTGTLAGTLGFFGSRIADASLLPVKIGINAGISTMAAITLQAHPHIKDQEVDYLALAAGFILTNGLGYTLQYSGVPNYVTMPVVMSANFIINILADSVASIKKSRQYIELHDIESPAVNIVNYGSLNNYNMYPL
jgi:hypothetical protein